MAGEYIREFHPIPLQCCSCSPGEVGQYVGHQRHERLQDVAIHIPLSHAGAVLGDCRDQGGVWAHAAHLIVVVVVEKQLQQLKIYVGILGTGVTV